MAKEVTMEKRALVLDILNKTKERLAPKVLLEPYLTRLPFNRPIHIFALGKAAYHMTEAVLSYAKRFPDLQIENGLVITRYDHTGESLPGISIIQSGHPYPDANSILAGKTAISYLKNLPSSDFLLVLLSGGGSSLIEKPTTDYTLKDIIRVTRDLMERGSDIEALNAERKKMSDIKGGKLLQHVNTRDIAILAMSDVPGDKAEIIASNPFVPEGFTDDRHTLSYAIIANNHTFCEGLAASAKEMLPDIRDNMVQILSTDLRGEAAKAGIEISRLAQFILKQQQSGLSSFRIPCFLIFGGETTVTVKGGGVGGRCCELALSAADAISGLKNVIVLAYATDGSDGVAKASGAMVDGETKSLLSEYGLSLSAYLDNNDSYTALNAVQAVLPAAPTGINLNDVVILYIYK
jgi:hydroxypyruvate reductase